MKEEIKIGEIKVIERKSIAAAEREYFHRRAEGCWQMVKPLKIVWSWKRLNYVARFSMRRVEKAYHIDDYLKDITKTMQYGAEMYNQHLKAMSEYRKQKS